MSFFCNSRKVATAAAGQLLRPKDALSQQLHGVFLASAEQFATAAGEDDLQYIKYCGIRLVRHNFKFYV